MILDTRRYPILHPHEQGQQKLTDLVNLPTHLNREHTQATRIVGTDVTRGSVPLGSSGNFTDIIRRCIHFTVDIYPVDIGVWYYPYS